MTMKDYYMMSIGAGMELRKKVEKFGEFLYKDFIDEYLRHAKVYKYEGNVFWIDSIHGIIDIK
jgi:hypothetical protein